MADIFNIKPECFLEAGDLRVLSYFGGRTDPVTGVSGTFHSGVDCVRELCGSNFATITAIADGVVTKCYFGEKSNKKYSNPRGNYIILSHSGGYSSLYQHLENRQFVLEGMKIAKGMPIGYMGNTGKSTGGHLHIEVHLDGNAIDPLPFLIKNAAIPSGNTLYHIPLSHPLKQGDCGYDVACLQEAIARISPVLEAEIISHSYKNGNFDGSFGPFMTKTIKDLQTLAGLEPSGVFDAPTHKLLTCDIIDRNYRINRAISLLSGK